MARPILKLVFVLQIALFIFTHNCVAQQADRNPFDRGLTEEFYDSLPASHRDVSLERKKEIYLELLKQRKACRNDDARCQAEIVTIMEYWQNDRLISTEPGYDNDYMLHHANLWFHTKVNQPAVILLIFLSYQQGLYGFPHDDELAKCWRELIKSEPQQTIKETATSCATLETKKFGIENPIVRD